MTKFLFVPFLLLCASLAQGDPVQIEQGGLQLNGNLVANGEDWRNGPVVLMVHGTLAHGGMEILTTLQDLLQEAGVSSLAITLSLGQSNREGMYDCASEHRHAQEDALTEIGGWLEWLEAQGVSHPSLLGHSRGGAQVAWYASEHPDQPLQAIFLLAPGIWNAVDAAAAYAEGNGTDLAPLVAKAKQWVEAGRGDELMTKTDFLYCDDASVTAATFLAYYGDDERRNTPSLLPRIPFPTVVFVASEDEVVEHLAAEVEPLVDGKRLRMVTIEGAGHFFRDLYAQDVVDVIAETLLP